NVTFSYPGADKRKPSLKNVSLRIAPGETVAIVGSNGSGKSTLLKVLLGLYDGHEGLHGDVHVNNTHISDYDMRGIYAPTAVVMQDFQRYSLTLRENVGLGSTSLLHDDEALKKALERGGASAVAKQIGLDALTALSGGQWQRVALARAFMAAPHADMVMFDEVSSPRSSSQQPSSNLDPEAEADLFRALHSLSSAQEGHRTTTIYVSHRMQTVGRAQRIILLEHGAIVESGTHERSSSSARVVTLTCTRCSATASSRRGCWRAT
ncbi:P-loop containing nucleoside triphosphate hydrolase protein, partial [Cutaneotrichosporon oleaginosum]